MHMHEKSSAHFIGVSSTLIQLRVEKMFRYISIIAMIAALIPSHAFAVRDQIRIVGSSTVYPFITVIAEEFGNKTDFKTPVVESTGTGGGFKLFCAGTGPRHPDITGASRPIKIGEIEMCGRNGVKEPAEIIIGMDGIVVANAVTAKKFKLSRRDLFMALAKHVPAEDGTVVENPYTHWNQINPSLPEIEISVYGPPPTSGTRDAFVELVMHKACMEEKVFIDRYADKKQRKKACGMMREDGAFIEAGENDNLIIQKLRSNEDALGIFGYSFLEENRDKVQGSVIEGAEPSFENIIDGKYPISRPLFLYVKKEHMKHLKGMADFVKEIVGEDALGEYGYLTKRGLIPMTEMERLKQRRKFGFR